MFILLQPYGNVKTIRKQDQKAMQGHLLLYRTLLSADLHLHTGFNEILFKCRQVFFMELPASRVRIVHPKLLVFVFPHLMKR